MRRVCPRVWRCGLFVLAVGAAVLGLGVYNGRTAPTGPRTASEGTEVPGVGPDACAPLMRAFRGGNREVGLETEHGLVAAVMPSALAAEGIRSFSCLSDNLVGRVEMIVVSIGRDDEVAQLVIPHADMEDGAVGLHEGGRAEGDAIGRLECGSESSPGSHGPVCDFAPSASSGLSADPVMGSDHGRHGGARLLTTSGRGRSSRPRCCAKRERRR